MPSLQALSITLRGITNDSSDPGVDIWRTATFPLIRRLLALGDADSLSLKVTCCRRSCIPLPGRSSVLVLHCWPTFGMWTYSWAPQEGEACPSTSDLGALPCLMYRQRTRSSAAMPGEQREQPGMQVHKRGAPPGGGGEVHVRVPNVRSLPPISVLEEGGALLLQTHAQSCA